MTLPIGHRGDSNYHRVDTVNIGWRDKGSRRRKGICHVTVIGIIRCLGFAGCYRALENCHRRGYDPHIVEVEIAGRSNILIMCDDNPGQRT